MAKSRDRVCLIDPDPKFRNTFQVALKGLGYDMVGFTNAQDFLSGFEPAHVFCLVIEATLQGMSGMELLEILQARKNHIPILMFTADGDIPMAVAAMKAGAFDFLEKPLQFDALTDRLLHARKLFTRHQKIEHDRKQIGARMDLLTPRELEVFRLMAEGMRNTDIAQKLGISRKTLDIHRAKVKDKMNARTTADLARWSMLYESKPGGIVILDSGGFVA
jgi:two-component system response regulator FixJ